MPKREIGLMGYIGEAVVEQWLHYKYPEDAGYVVVSQIIPETSSRKGGGYLDFGIIRSNNVITIFEVKTQDYIFDRSEPKLNQALVDIWSNPSVHKKFLTQNGKHYFAEDDMTAYLILLAPPNKDGIQRIGKSHLKQVILFRDIWEDLSKNNFAPKQIVQYFIEDLKKILYLLRKPTQGKTMVEPFRKQRGCIKLIM